MGRHTSVVSEEELQLRKRARRRLVGAIALVALAVIVLPLLLDREPGEPLRNVQVDMAPPPGPVPEVSAPPPPSITPSIPAAADPPEPARASSPPPDPPMQASAVPPPAAPKEGVAPPAVAQPKSLAVAPKPNHSDEYVIQLGAFANPARAQALERRLKKAGVPVYLERVHEPSRTRVRAGPYASREAAQRAYEQMRQRGLTEVATLGQIVPRGQ